MPTLLHLLKSMVQAEKGHPVSGRSLGREIVSLFFPFTRSTWAAFQTTVEAAIDSTFVK
jgi:hypothetical protein